MDFNQVFRRKNQVNILKYVGRWAGVNIFFYSYLLLHFSRDVDQTFTKALPSSAVMHIVGVLLYISSFGGIIAL